MIDNLNLIIGNQSKGSNSYDYEAKNRLNYVLTKFIKAVASVGSLILVLQDLQWMDSASLDLIKVLIRSRVKNLMLIGVYRDDEVCCSHQLSDLLNFVREINITPIEIALENMDHESLNEFISDTLCISPVSSYPLTAFVYGKTAGNPFFVKQM